MEEPRSAEPITTTSKRTRSPPIAHNGVPVGKSEPGPDPPVLVSATRQSLRRRSSPKGDDSDSATSSYKNGISKGNQQAGVTPRVSLRRSPINGSDKKNTSAAEDRDGLGATNLGSVRQSTRTRIARQAYNEHPPKSSPKEEKCESLEPTGSEEQSADEPSIDACASLLAMLDERSYHRDVLRDANQLSQQLLIPLALPWKHKGNPVARNIAYDIDDMTEILTADDGHFTPHENGPFGFGRFDIGQLRRGPINTRLATSADSWCAASRRTEDPGIIEFSSVALPMSSLRERNSSESKKPACPDHHFTGKTDGDQTMTLGSEFVPAGELSLRYYEHTTKSKKRKISEVQSCIERKLISVKVNSSSSRSSIFQDLKMDSKSRYGKLLEAYLPTEVQNGKFMNTSKAQKIAENLGTYDCRHGLSTTNTATRLSCGRTRLIWTEKSSLEQHQKPFYLSSLTGQKIEGVTQKRPRDVRIVLRVDGEIFGSEQSSGEPAHKLLPMLGALPMTITAAESDDLFEYPRAQCMLDDERFVRNMLNDGTRSGHARGRARCNLSQPMIECLPDCNGLIGVVCSSPGKIVSSSVHETLNYAAKGNFPKCTICWESDLDRNIVVRECCDCGLIVHPQCCYDGGELLQPLDSDSGKRMGWRCAVCCYKMRQHEDFVTRATAVADPAKKSRRKTKLPQWLQDSHIDGLLTAGRSDQPLGEKESHGIKCSLCSYHGGAMSRVNIGDKYLWVHEICRIWLKGRKSPEAGNGQGSTDCVLCGKGQSHSTGDGPSEDVGSMAGYVLKCAAARCNVHFHPMCGLLTTKLAETAPEPNSAASTTPNTSLEIAKEVDRKLCTFYTLTGLDVEVKSDAHGKDPGAETTLKLPIGFCGIHNPKREPGFRGLYPGGQFITSEMMKIPAVNSD